MHTQLAALGIMHLLFTGLYRAICSTMSFQMEEGETKFEEGYIQLARGLSKQHMHNSLCY